MCMNVNTHWRGTLYTPGTIYVCLFVNAIRELQKRVLYTFHSLDPIIVVLDAWWERVVIRELLRGHGIYVSIYMS